MESKEKHQMRRLPNSRNNFLGHGSIVATLNTTDETIERDGYTITLRRSPFWRALSRSHSGINVDTYGDNREDAIQKVILKAQRFDPREAAAL